MDRIIDKRVPCYQCPDRHLHCHDACEAYRAYRAEKDALTAKRLAEYARTHDADERIRISAKKKRRRS